MNSIVVYNKSDHTHQIGQAGRQTATNPSCLRACALAVSSGLLPQISILHQTFLLSFKILAVVEHFPISDIKSTELPHYQEQCQ